MKPMLIATPLVLTPAGAAAQPVSIATRVEADKSHTMVHEVLVEAPVAEVWDAVSTAQGWKEWAAPAAWSQEGLLETSYSPAAVPGDPSTIRQWISGRSPGRLLAFQTVKAPERFPHFDTFRLVSNVIELEPVAEQRTRVRLTASGYPATEAGRLLLGFFREGNKVSLERLRQRFATGPIDWSKVEQ